MTGDRSDFSEFGIVSQGHHHRRDKSKRAIVYEDTESECYDFDVAPDGPSFEVFEVGLEAVDEVGFV
ncbi:MAG TPA: hypothetical protein VJM34_04485, partial [Novosphingobium sp.]|nr:hypothetical protein [Novosphingobium sp.]